MPPGHSRQNTLEHFRYRKTQFEVKWTSNDRTTAEEESVKIFPKDQEHLARLFAMNIAAGNDPNHKTLFGSIVHVYEVEIWEEHLEGYSLKSIMEGLKPPRIREAPSVAPPNGVEPEIETASAPAPTFAPDLDEEIPF